MTIEQLIREDLLNLAPYEPADLQAAADRSGLAVQQLIRLDSNENPYGPSPQVALALADCTEFQYYPDYREVREALADYAGVKPSQVVLGNGADELIDLLIRVFVAAEDAIVVCPPAFGMYGFFAHVNGCHVLEVPRDSDFALDTAALEESILGAAGAAQAKLLFLTSPGNPDGQIISTNTIERLLQLPVVVVVDEAYVEFGERSCAPLLGDYPNLVILRTLSKWAGLAGLRLGYVLSSPDTATMLQRVRAPYNVNAAALVAALASLADLDFAQANITRLVEERQRVYEALLAMHWIDPLPSQANFLLCRLQNGSGQQLAESLLERGILVRSFSDNRLRSYVRFTIGTPEQNRSLLAAVQDIESGRTA